MLTTEFLLGEIKSINSKMENLVTYQHFYWIIGILVIILIAVMTYLVQLVSDIRQDTNSIVNTLASVGLEVK